MISDSDLIQKIKDGNSQMFSLLVDQYKDKVFNLVYRFTGDYGEAEDVAQEVFLAVYKSLHSFKASSSVSTWIYRIASNKCIDWHRKKKRKSFFNLFGENEEMAQVKADTPAPQEAYIMTEEQRELQQAVKQLDEKYRMMLIMFYYQHLSYKEIAEILGVSVRTVETRLYRGKKILKDYLVVKGYGGELNEARQS